jgi:predicted transposase YbfD/YdcC
VVSSWRASLEVRLIAPGELERFNAELDANHWLGHRLSGRVLRYVATIDGRWAAVAGFGSAALACAARDEFVGWDHALRLRRLGLITSNQRFCVLPTGRRPHLASAVLGGCLRRLPADHLAVWGRPVLAVETFTDPARHAGSCYAAAGFTPLGPSAGYARGRGTKIRHGAPKVYWLRPLHRHGLAALAAAFDSPLIAPRQGRPVVDLNTVDIDGPGGLLAVLGQVPEHRKARGIRHDLPALLAVAVAAVLSGANSTAAIAQYARTLTQPALATLGVRRNKRTGTHVAPAYQTLRRAIRSVDAHALDTAVTGWLHAQVHAGRLTAGQLTALVVALDGKTVRGARDADGTQLHLFAALVHGEATVIAQHPVDAKTNELSGFVPLLDQIAQRHHPRPDHHPDDDDADDIGGDDDDDDDGDDPDSPSSGAPSSDAPSSDAPSSGAPSSGAPSSGAPSSDADNHPGGAPGKLDGVIVTADALHTQRAHARYLREHGGHYVLVAKGNQPKLYAALDELPWTTVEVGHREQENRHGRRDVRVLKVIDLADPAHAHHRVRFPGARQAFLIERYRHFPDGTTTAAAILGITSLPPDHAGPAELATIIRGHWHIEALHHIRDVTFNEDASRIRAGAAARVMAVLRNLAISLLKRAGYHNIAEGRRAAAWDRNRLALDILGL